MKDDARNHEREARCNLSDLKFKPTQLKQDKRFVSLVSPGNSGSFTLLIGPLKQQKNECSTQGMAADGGVQSHGKKKTIQVLF
jgi:hypothetical protein